MFLTKDGGGNPVINNPGNVILGSNVDSVTKARFVEWTGNSTTVDFQSNANSFFIANLSF